ncbi:MAG: hypothetical protein AABX54_05710 [Nanoarchaeota archaeon]
MKFLSNNKTKNASESIALESGLCDEIALIVKASPVEYPNIKNFIENAIKYKINRIKYNIENYDAVVTKDGNLIGKSNNVFTRCPVCDNLFLNKKERIKNGKYICPRCSEIVKYFVRRL